MINRSRHNIEASRLRKRIEKLITEFEDRRSDLDTLRNARNNYAAFQVKSFVTSTKYAAFGTGNGKTVSQ